MTRGTLFVFLPSDRLISSTEFNGDMYGSTKDSLEERVDGHYKTVIKKMISVEGESTFNEAVAIFNKENHDYEGQITFEEKVEEFYNFDGNYLVKRCNSDYTFWKNCSGKKVELIDENEVVVELRDGEIATFYYGEYIEMFSSKDKWDDIFKRFDIS